MIGLFTSLTVNKIKVSKMRQKKKKNLVKTTSSHVKIKGFTKTQVMIQK